MRKQIYQHRLVELEEELGRLVEAVVENWRNGGCSSMTEQETDWAELAEGVDKMKAEMKEVPTKRQHLPKEGMDFESSMLKYTKKILKKLKQLEFDQQREERIKEKDTQIQQQMRQIQELEGQFERQKQQMEAQIIQFELQEQQLKAKEDELLQLMKEHTDKETLLQNMESRINQILQEQQIQQEDHEELLECKEEEYNAMERRLKKELSREQERNNQLTEELEGYQSKLCD